MDENDIIIELANRLGIAVTDIHAIYTEAIVGIAITNLIGLVVSCIVMIIIFRLTISAIIRKNLSSDYESERKRDSFMKFDIDDDIAPLVIVMLCAFIIIGLPFTICIDVIQQCLYPEYFAIEEMLTTFSGN